MSLDTLPVHVQSALKSIISDAGLKNYTTEVKSGTHFSDGSSGALTSVIAKGVDANDKEIELNLLCKLAPTDENLRKECKIEMILGREISFYTKVLPAFIDFQQEKLLPEEDRFRAYPKAYTGHGVDGELDYAIIMDDLRPQGFQMFTKTKPTTLDNIRLVLEQIGKFHAISFAMKDQKPEQFAEFEQFVDLSHTFLTNPNVPAMFVNSFKRAKNALRADHHKEIMTKLTDNCVEYLSACLKDNGSSKFCVMTHGDLWNNNILYRFDENNVAVDVRFVDWPGIRYMSPAMDVIYHISVGTDKSLRDAEYMNLLKHYHDCLSQMIKLLGSDPDKLFTFDNLLDEMKRAGNHAFTFAPMVISICLADPSQVTSLDERLDSNNEANIELIKELSNDAQIEYENRVNDLVGDLVDLGYFNELK